jgi:chemotaxis protein methyltransferase CheR
MTSVTSLLESATMTERQFTEVADLVKGLCGINLHVGKRELVRARLATRLRTLGLSRFEDYLVRVRNDTTGNEVVAMLDALSTNLTSFFREADHFQYLAERVVPRIAARGGQPRLRVWSAGCSSGEEPYSIAMTLAEKIADLARWDIAILATDLSTRVLARAAQGVYEADRVEPLAAELRRKYFEAEGGRQARTYRVTDRLRRMAHFARLNLMGPWPMKGPLNVIFCRNVMIYFDKPTQVRLIERFFELLEPGGTLCVGHSESLAGVKHDFQYVQPTVYEKP